jgi:hypothetical protein
MQAIERLTFSTHRGVSGGERGGVGTGRSGDRAIGAIGIARIAENCQRSPEIKSKAYRGFSQMNADQNKTSPRMNTDITDFQFKIIGLWIFDPCKSLLSV